MKKIITSLLSFGFVLLVPFFLYQGVKHEMVVEGMFCAYACLLISLVSMMGRGVYRGSKMQRS